MISGLAALVPRAHAGAEGEGTATCRLSGKVIDVGAQKALGGFGFMLFAQAPDEGGSTSVTVTTKEDGTFEARVPRGATVSAYLYPTFLGQGSAHLLDMAWLQAEGRSMVTVGKVTDDRADVVIEAKVRPTQPLSGKVLANGKPVSGAVFLAPYVSAPRTDEDGRFTLKLAPADGDYELCLVSADRKYGALARVKKGTQEATFTLSRTCALSGRVTATDGKPAGKLSFSLLPQVNGESLYGLQVSCKTDRRGAYTAKGLVPGVKYAANWSDAGDYCAGSASVVAAPGATLALRPKRFRDDWQAAGNIGLHPSTRSKSLTDYGLAPNGNLLACDGPNKAVRVISADDERLAVWRLGFMPQAIECRDDGTAVVAGQGQVALLSSEGQVLKQQPLPDKAETATAVGSSGADVFVCVQRSTGYAIYRLNENLADATLTVKGLRGCCGQMDFTARDGVLYVAANALFKVARYDRDGKELGSFGQRATGEGAGFDGCCEPKNVCFDTAGSLYTADSGSRLVRKWTTDGKYLGAVGSCEGVRGCVRVTIAVTRDGSKVYMLDTGRNIIRMIPMKPGKADGKA
jgi:sugar lactone lactonase YvrE